MKRETIAIHTPYDRPDVYGALAVPVYNNVSFEFPDAQQMSDAFCNRIKAPDYARMTNPTVTNFEQRVRAITGAAHVTAFNSGMAAISNALISVAENGKNIVTTRHLFGNSLSLIANTLLRFGVRSKLRDLTNLEVVEQAVDENTCCIFLEIVTNPQLEVADLRALADIAHRRGIPLIADSTVIPFSETRLRDHRVDIEVVSSTKYLSGGGSSLGGLVIDYGSFPQFNKRLKYEALVNLGAYMTPQVAYIQTLGLETLDVRYKRQAQNALWLARELKKEKAIMKVNYVGLPDNPYYDLARRQFTTSNEAPEQEGGGILAGAMLTIDLISREACFNFLNKLKLIHRATNLFDSRTLAIHHASTIFGLFPDRQLQQMDVYQTTIRLSVGLEAPEDLLEDIRQALK